MEKIVIGLGVAVGVAAGFAFFGLWRDLPLPGFLFFLVDVLGALVASIVFGVVTAIVATGVFVLLIEMLWPTKQKR